MSLESIFLKATFQTCILHLIRYSMQFASWKERKAIAKALRPIYQPETVELVTEGLEEFDRRFWGEKYSAIASAWWRKWERVKRWTPPVGQNLSADK